MMTKELRIVPGETSGFAVTISNRSASRRDYEGVERYDAHYVTSLDEVLVLVKEAFQS